MPNPAHFMVLLSSGSIALAALLTANAAAQVYPVKPVRMLVGFTEGGAADVIVRIVAQKMTEQVGRGILRLFSQPSPQAGRGGFIEMCKRPCFSVS
jgi:hypothetical protein